MSFILIEGDNGTGKDTLALKLENKGLKVVTYDSRIKQFEKKAKKLFSKDKVKAFIEYNYTCSDFISNLKTQGIVQDFVLVRYWISTLAAAYADNIFNEDKVIELGKKMAKPDLVIRLNCNYHKRIQRIEKRNSDEYDDKTIDRANKYKKISKKLRQISDYKWEEIDTTTLNEIQVYEKVIKLLSI